MTYSLGDAGQPQDHTGKQLTHNNSLFHFQYKIFPKNVCVGVRIYIAQYSKRKKKSTSKFYNLDININIKRDNSCKILRTQPGT